MRRVRRGGTRGRGRPESVSVALPGRHRSARVRGTGRTPGLRDALAAPGPWSRRAPLAGVRAGPGRISRGRHGSGRPWAPRQVRVARSRSMPRIVEPNRVHPGVTGCIPGSLGRDGTFGHHRRVHRSCDPDGRKGGLPCSGACRRGQPGVVPCRRHHPHGLAAAGRPCATSASARSTTDARSRVCGSVPKAAPRSRPAGRRRRRRRPPGARSAPAANPAAPAPSAPPAGGPAPRCRPGRPVRSAGP